MQSENLERLRMLETFDGDGGSEISEGWFGRLEGRRVQHEIRSSGGQAGLVARSVVRLSFQEVLQYVHLREADKALSLSDARGLGERLLCVLTSCHEVDTARRRLLGAMNARQTLDEVAHLLKARARAGVCAPVEPSRLAVMRTDLCRSVEVATAMWEMAGRHFTRVTRLLPAQLDVHTEGFVPLTKAELAWLERHARELDVSEQFSRAQERYRVAVMDWERARTRWTLAREARQLAEAGFRCRARCALAFAGAVVSQHWEHGSLVVREAHVSMRRHTLYSTVLLLPRQLGLI